MYSIFDVKTFSWYINVATPRFILRPFLRRALTDRGRLDISFRERCAPGFPFDNQSRTRRVYIGEICNFSQCNAKMCTQRQPRSKRRKRGDLVTRETFHWNVGKKRKKKERKNREETKGMTSKERRKGERLIERGWRRKRRGGQLKTARSIDILFRFLLRERLKQAIYLVYFHMKRSLARSQRRSRASMPSPPPQLFPFLSIPPSLFILDPHGFFTHDYDRSSPKLISEFL